MSSARYDALYQLAWWLCVVTLPWSIHLNSISILLLASVWLAEGNWRGKWQRLKQSSWTLPFVLFFAFHLLGLLLTQNVNSGLTELEKKATFVILPLIASSGKPLDSAFFHLLKKNFVYSCALLAIGSLAYAVYHFSTSAHDVFNFGSRTDELFHLLNPNASSIWEYVSYIQLGRWLDLHPGYFSLHVVFCLLILLDGMKDESGVNVKSIGWIFFFTLILALLASRMALFCLGVVLIYFTIVNGRKTTARAYAVGFIFVALLTMVWVNPVSRYRVIQEPNFTGMKIHRQLTEWNSVNLRLLEWQASWNTIRNVWFTGVGTGDGQKVLKDYYGSFNSSTRDMDFNSHNQYFQTVIELGVAGLISLLFCFFLPLFQPGQSALHLFFILLFAVMCLTECLLARQKGVVFFTLFQSLFLSIRPIDLR